MPNRLPQLRGCPASPGRQRGATLVFTAFTLVALVATMGLAVDVGRLYATQTQLQRTAEVAALDAARTIGGCLAGDPDNPQGAAESAVAAAIANQSDDDGAPAISSDVQLGVQQTNGNLLGFAPSNPFEADSVQVTLSRPSPTPLVAFFTADRSLNASATAMSRPQAGLSVGSSLVSVGGLAGNNGLLSALLGGPVSLDAVSYQGLVDADVTIGELLDAQISAGTVDNLLATDLSLPGALNLLADAIDTTAGSAEAAAAATLQQLASIADAGRTVALGDIVSVESGLGSLIDSLPINVAGLLSGLAQAANQGAPVQLPVGINLGGLANATGQVNVIEPPQIAFGRAGLDRNGQPRTVANTAQVAIQLQVTVLGALPSVLGGALINLPIYLKIASAQAVLDDINCAGPANPDNTGGTFQHTASVTTGTSIAQFGIGEFGDISAFDPQVPSPSQTTTLVNALGVARIRTTGGIQVDLGAGSSPEELDFVGPFPPQPDAEPQTERVGSPVGDSLASGLQALANQLASPGRLQLQVLGLDPLGLLSALLGGLVGTVVNLVTPVLAIVDNILLTPLLELLGVAIGTADVTVQSVIVDQPNIYCTDRQCNAD